jgi:hypothetical protein
MILIRRHAAGPISCGRRAGSIPETHKPILRLASNTFDVNPDPGLHCYVSLS